MDLEKRKNYFRDYYQSKQKSKYIPAETNEITQRLFQIQNKYKRKTPRLIKAYVIYFYWSLGMTYTQIRDYLDVALNIIHENINNINADALVWRSEMYYIQKEIKEFANEYKAKI